MWELEEQEELTGHLLFPLQATDSEPQLGVLSWPRISVSGGNYSDAPHHWPSKRSRAPSILAFEYGLRYSIRIFSLGNYRNSKMLKSCLAWARIRALNNSIHACESSTVRFDITCELH